MPTIKQLQEIAENAGVSLAEIASEVEKGGKPTKPYVLSLRFDRLASLLAFVREHCAEPEVAVFKGIVTDPEFGSSVPANGFVLRHPNTDRPTDRVD